MQEGGGGRGGQGLVADEGGEKEEVVSEEGVGCEEDFGGPGGERGGAGGGEGVRGGGEVGGDGESEVT